MPKFTLDVQKMSQMTPVTAVLHVKSGHDEITEGCYTPSPCSFHSKCIFRTIKAWLADTFSAETCE